MALDKTFNCTTGLHTLRARTAINGHNLIVSVYDETDDVAVSLSIPDVAALHAILGNWLKKRDRRVGLAERRMVGHLPVHVVNRTGRRSNDYGRGNGRRKGDAR